jgi:hypothetical protein
MGILRVTENVLVYRYPLNEGHQQLVVESFGPNWIRLDFTIDGFFLLEKSKSQTYQLTLHPFSKVLLPKTELLNRKLNIKIL